MSFETVSGNHFFADFKRYLPLLKNLISKDFKIKYRRSVLGVAWSVLNPLLSMIVITLVFSKVLRVGPPAGIDFPVYYIVGSSLWGFFSESTRVSLNSVIGSASLIKKVYIPKYMFTLEKCLFSLVNFSFTLIAVFLVMIIRGVFPTFAVFLFPIPVIYCFAFAFGMSLFLSATNVFFRDIEHLYDILLTLWVYLTPIFYSPTMFDGKDGKLERLAYFVIVKFNPLTHFIEYFRALMIGGYGAIPSLNENLWCFAISAFMLIFGILVFKKAEKKFILYI